MATVTEVIDGTDEVKEIEEVVETVKEESPIETIEVTIGDADPEPNEDKVSDVRLLREANREKKKHIAELKRSEAELKRKLDAIQGVPETIGVKPKLEDFQYDQDRYDEAYEKYVLKKAENAALEKKKEEEKAKADADWQTEQQSYEEEKKTFKLKAPDFDDADSTIAEKLSPTQRGIIIHAAKSRTTLVYALYKNPQKLDELAKITDPVKFTWELSQIEGAVKVTTKTHQAEERVTGVPSTGGAKDVHLEKLRAEANRTGDVSKVMAYKRQLKQKAA